LVLNFDHKINTKLEKKRVLGETKNKKHKEEKVIEKNKQIVLSTQIYHDEALS